MYNCTHHCTAALQIRLVGGGSNPFSGRVEYYLQGIWATVCDDYFGTADGNVVCNQLGYGNATGTPKFGAGSGSIAFDDLDCSGDEISLLFCPHLGNFQHNCGHIEDVGVICEGKYDDGELCCRLPRFPIRDTCAICYDKCILACLQVHIHTHTHTHICTHSHTTHTHSCTHTYRHNLIPYTSAYSIIYFTLAHMPSTPHYHSDNGTPNETSSVSASDVSSGSGKW